MSMMHELYQLLGKLLEYPTGETPMYSQLCLDLMDGGQSGGAGPMAEFSAHAEGTGLGRLEEQYTASFDLSPECSPYAGCQLLAEDPKRAVLMVKLRECYRAHGFDEGRELPDHVAVILGFLSGLRDPELEMEMVGEVVIPALARMGEAIGERNPYRHLLKASTLALSELALGEGNVPQEPPPTPRHPAVTTHHSSPIAHDSSLALGGPADV